MMFNFLKKIFANKEPRSSEVFACLYDTLKDKKYAQEIEKKGYVVLPFLNEETLKTLNKNKEKYLANLKNKPDTLFYTSGRDEVENRNLAKQLTWHIVEPFLNDLVNIDKTHIEGCAFLLKPPGEKGELYPHQDSSLIDETKYASFYGWIPLQNVSEHNGTINVIPGSHRWGIHYRSLDVPWPLEEHWDLLREYSLPLNIKAGNILLFDSALIHGSGINQSEQLRAALNLYFKPKEAPMVHYMIAQDTPTGFVESYQITTEFFLNHDFRKRPDTNLFPFKGFLKEAKTKFEKKELQKLLKNF